MEILATRIPDVKVIRPKVFGDSRGYFMETFRYRVMADEGIGPDFVQDNQSMSRQGILRGLHYQIQNPQGKLVTVIKGAVFDVVVDLRQFSPTFGQWVGEELNEENKALMWVPPGFAHGFLVLRDETVFSYKCTDYYAPEHECCLKWDDPRVGVQWPTDQLGEVHLSEKDQHGTAWDDVPKFD